MFAFNAEYVDMKEYVHIDDNVLKILEDAFSKGASDVQACFLANISTQTLYNYQKENPTYVERKEALKDMIKFRAKQVVVSEIEKGNVQQANWYLERKAKDEFSTRAELTGKDGGNLVIQTINYADTNSPQLPAERLPDTNIQGD